MIFRFEIILEFDVVYDKSEQIQWNHERLHGEHLPPRSLDELNHLAKLLLYYL